jgi:2-methylisocitrate lyase-like PEP mutase family enzyme
VLRAEGDARALSEKAARLRALHKPGQPLVLVNVWDCASARVVEKAGAPAIATTSAGVAFANGYPDGQRISPERMLEAVARICGAVSVPVTADLESGYGDSSESLERTVAGMLEAGAVGLNLEDHSGAPTDPLVELELQLDKIRAVREAGKRRGVPIVLNARTDSYLRGLGSPEECSRRRSAAVSLPRRERRPLRRTSPIAVIGEIVRRCDARQRLASPGLDPGSRASASPASRSGPVRCARR